MAVDECAPSVSLPALESKPKPATGQRLRRPERPNRLALDEHLGSLHAQMDALQARADQIRALLDAKQHNAQMASPETLQARARLRDIDAAFRAAVESCRNLYQELELFDRARERARADARALREQLPYVSVDKIDAEIQKLEQRIAHSSLKLPEEKRVVAQIEALRKSRELVREHSNQVAHGDEARNQILEKIREKDHLLDSLKAKQTEQRTLLAQIREKEASQTQDIPSLLQEKKAAIERIRSLRDEVKKAREEFRAKQNEYIEKEREWRAQQAAERKMRNEIRSAEWKEREKVRQLRAMENYVEPYTDEIILCDQLISYMQKFVPLTEALRPSTVASSQKSNNPVMASPVGFGSVIVSKKNRMDDDLDGWFGGLGSKNGKSKKGGKAPSLSKSKEKERISHSLDAVTSFEKVSVAAPATVADVLKSLDELKGKKEAFIKLQQDAREAKLNGTEVPVVADTVEEEEAEEELDNNIISADEIMEGVDLTARADDDTVKAADDLEIVEEECLGSGGIDDLKKEDVALEVEDEEAAHEAKKEDLVLKVEEHKEASEAKREIEEVSKVKKEVVVSKDRDEEALEAKKEDAELSEVIKEDLVSKDRDGEGASETKKDDAEVLEAEKEDLVLKDTDQEASEVRTEDLTLTDRDQEAASEPEKEDLVSEGKDKEASEAVVDIEAKIVRNGDAHEDQV